MKKLEIFIKKTIMQSTGYSDSRRRHQIIGLLDPTGIDQSLLTLDLKKLVEELDKKTNSLVEIKHDEYFAISDITTSGMNREDELALVKFHLTRKEEDVKKLAAMLRAKEDELYLRERNLDRKNSKSPARSRDGSEFDQENAGRLSSSPVSYQSYLYKPENRNTPVEQIITTAIINAAVDPATNNFSSGSPIQIPHETINGSLTEEEAILKAIRESEKESNDIIDKPFEDSSRIAEIRSIPIQSNKITAESLRSEGKSPYCMLANRPDDATDELLDSLYNILSSRDFTAAKAFLANKDLPLHILRWIKTLKFNDTTLTQMLLSKPVYIHKCLRPYE